MPISAIISKAKEVLQQVKRLGFDIFLFFVFVIGGWLMFDARVDEMGNTTYVMKGDIPPFISLVMLKALLVSCGVLHAHITRKLLLPKVDWNERTWSPNEVAAIMFYVLFVFAYARGG